MNDHDRIIFEKFQKGDDNPCDNDKNKLIFANLIFINTKVYMEIKFYIKKT